MQVAGLRWLARAGRREEAGETPSEGLEEDPGRRPWEYLGDDAGAALEEGSTANSRQLSRTSVNLTHPPVASDRP